MKKILALNKCRKAFLFGVGATIGTIVVIFLLVSVGYEGVLIPSPWLLFQQSTQIKSQAYYPFNLGQSSADDNITQVITGEYNKQMAGIPKSDRPSIDQWYSGGNGSSRSGFNIFCFAPCSGLPGDPCCQNFSGGGGGNGGGGGGTGGCPPCGGGGDGGGGDGGGGGGDDGGSGTCPGGCGFMGPDPNHPSGCKGGVCCPVGAVC